MPLITKAIVMSRFHQLALLFFFLFSLGASAQKTISGKVIDALTKEPVAGVSVHCSDPGCTCGCMSKENGLFELNCTDCKNLQFTFIGYTTKNLAIHEITGLIELLPSNSLMNTVVVTASRGEAVKRAQAPVAITTLSARTIQDTRPSSVEQLLNKVSGVHMVNLGNEQHQMSIRQPMTTKSLFLYLVDGIPVRTTGLFNHNALLEMNMASVKNIEVIKGPSSSLYGSEAIGGVVNFISQAPTAAPLFKLSTQANSIGYKRADVQASFIKNKWGVVLSGYYADKRNSFMDYSDFHKGTGTARIDYRFSDKTNLSNNLTWLKYYSDMPGGVDSTMFAAHTFTNPQTFTYRKVDALRYHSTLTQTWNADSKTTATIIYRENAIGQNPNYRIRDDFKKTGAVWTGRKDLAHGEINKSSFHSYAFVAQHRQNLKWKNAAFIGGVSMDLSPSAYQAEYIRIRKDSVTKKYISYQSTDSILTQYTTGINNYAGFVNIELSPAKNLRLVASLRYDRFTYRFNNQLQPSSFSGAADTVNHFSRVSPKVGLTYSLSAKTGLYANYSQGFVPPQVTELFTGVNVPHLAPSVFYNYEIGGWSTLIKNKLSLDFSIYQLEGTNEVISVKLDNGAMENQNAGRTKHKGIEFGLQAIPSTEWSVRVSGAYSEHRFVRFTEKGNSYDGNEMNGAPRWMHNAEVWYKPSFAKGLRVGAEWQHIGSYFMDPKNTVKYEGYQVLNLRAGYQYRGAEIWVHVMNANNNYYSYISTKSNSGFSYQLAEPRNYVLGLSYDLGQLVKK
jgi:outer membrane receptor protein involved in Fe transport